MAGALIHLAYKTPNGGGVPSPVDPGFAGPWPLDTWSSMLPEFAAHGITVAMLPPVTKGASLGGGWDPFDNYDIGSKVQRGRLETRYGSAEQLRRFVAVANACGMEVGVNVVHHHVDGDSGNWVYQYPGADVVTLNGRFPKDKNCFWTKGSQNPDTVPVPAWDLGFGREFEWMSGSFGDGKGENGPAYPGRNLIAALEWQLQTIGAKQVFWDDLKGTDANYIAWATNTLWEKGLIDFAFGEYFEGDREILGAYVSNYPIVQTTGVLDFSIRFALSNWCNSPGGYDMRQLTWNGLNFINPAKAVTFTDDADTALSEPFWRVLQASAAIATMPGYPMFFGQYSYPTPDGYGLGAKMQTLAWINATMNHGPFVWRAAEYDYVVYERPAAPGLLVGLSNRAGDFDNPNDWTAVDVQTGWWPKTVIHDHAGHADDQTVRDDGTVTIWLPPVDNSGRGYVCYGQNFQQKVQGTARPTTQVFFGASDLDIGPATPTGSFVARIWCEAHTEVSLNHLDGDGVRFKVTDVADTVIIDTPTVWSARTARRGWHTITATAPGKVDVPYTLECGYTGTKGLTSEEMVAA